jgi:type II secretory pathway pseudopilin PulG
MADETQPSAEDQQAVEPTKTSKLSKLNSVSLKDRRVQRTLVELILVVAVVLLALAAWNLRKDRNDVKSQLASLKANPQLAVDQQTKDLIGKVSHLYNLPTNETPTIAEVSDPAKAKQQSAFFANAQKGDKVLLYVKAGEAILYRPTTNKIILVAPLTFSNSSKSSNKTSTSTNTSTSTTPSTSSPGVGTNQ